MNRVSVQRCTNSDWKRYERSQFEKNKSFSFFSILFGAPFCCDDTFGQKRARSRNRRAISPPQRGIQVQAPAERKLSCLNNGIAGASGTELVSFALASLML